jgi:hypothetical protein
LAISAEILTPLKLHRTAAASARLRVAEPRPLSGRVA